MRHEIGLGEVFGKLHVIGKEKIKYAGTRYRCKCECGCESVTTANNLRSGNSTSCGKCHRITHGLTHSRIYRTWKSMRQRCQNPNDYSFKNYGGRGIKVCDRWNVFENFHADMGDPPEGKTMDRIDNDGDYCKENCRWATWAEQHGNKRNSKYLTAFGRSQSLHAWAREYKVHPRTLHNRINRGGASLETALVHPPSKGRKI